MEIVCSTLGVYCLGLDWAKEAESKHSIEFGLCSKVILRKC